MHCTGVQDAFRGFVVPPWDAWRTRLVRARVLPVDGVAKCLSRLERWSRGRSDGDALSGARVPSPPGRALPGGECTETRDGHWLAPRQGVADGGNHGANHPVGCGLGQRRLSGDIGGELGSVPGACCSPFICGLTPPTTKEISLDEIERIHIGPNVHIWTSCRM